MISKKVTYVDFNGTQRTDVLYFNLSKHELLELEFEVDGGMSTVIEKMVEVEDKQEMLRFFQTLITKSYGEKSPDGRRFDKNKEITEQFYNSAAYAQIFDELLADESGELAIEFFKGVLPDLSEFEKKPEEQPQRRTSPD